LCSMWSLAATADRQLMTHSPIAAVPHLRSPHH
jgi:hypothetical protein